MPFIRHIGDPVFLLLATAALATAPVPPAADATEPNDAKSSTTEIPSDAQLARFAIEDNGDDLAIAASDNSGPVKDDKLELDYTLQGNVGDTTVALTLAQYGFGDIVGNKIQSGAFGKDIDTADMQPGDMATVGKFDPTYEKQVFAVVMTGGNVEHRDVDWLENFQAAGSKAGIVRDGKLKIVDTDALFAAVRDDQEIEIQDDDATAIEFPAGATLTNFTDGENTYVAFQYGQEFVVVKPSDEPNMAPQLARYTVRTPGAKLMASLGESGRNAGFTQIVSDFEDNGAADIKHNLTLEEVLEPMTA